MNAPEKEYFDKITAELLDLLEQAGVKTCRPEARDNTLAGEMVQGIELEVSIHYACVLVALSSDPEHARHINYLQSCREILLKGGTLADVMLHKLSAE